MIPCWDGFKERLSSVTETDPVATVPERDKPGCWRTKGRLCTGSDWVFLQWSPLYGVPEEEDCFLESGVLGKEGAGMVRGQGK